MSEHQPDPTAGSTPPSTQKPPATPVMPPGPPKEYGGPAGPEPTRYGDWEQKGRCTDF